MRATRRARRSPAAQQQIGAVVANLGGNPNIAPDKHPAVQQAQARLDRAKLDLSYTTIAAPSDGIVTRVDQLQVGSYIAASAPVFALVSTSDVWVEANFKEDQLTHMRVGQAATVKVDSYPGKSFAGKVASLSPGTGSQFSVLPPENATGNWVKVVQRLPVRVRLDAVDPAFPLHAGLSADVSVDTQHRRHLFGAAEARGDGTAVGAAVSDGDRTRRAGRGGAASRPHHRLGDARLDHAGARQHDRQRRPAAHPGVAVGDAGPDDLGADLLHHRRGDHDAALRLARRADRQKARLPRSPSSASRSPRRSAAWRSRCRRSSSRGCCRACAARR